MSQSQGHINLGNGGKGTGKPQNQQGDEGLRIGLDCGAQPGEHTLVVLHLIAQNHNGENAHPQTEGTHHQGGDHLGGEELPGLYRQSEHQIPFILQKSQVEPLNHQHRRQNPGGDNQAEEYQHGNCLHVPYQTVGIGGGGGHREVIDGRHRQKGQPQRDKHPEHGLKIVFQKLKNHDIHLQRVPPGKSPGTGRLRSCPPADGGHPHSDGAPSVRFSGTWPRPAPAPHPQSGGWR